MPLLSSIPALADAAETLRLLLIAIGLAGIAALLDSRLQRVTKAPAWLTYGSGFGVLGIAAMQFPVVGLFGLPVDLRAPVVALAALVAGPRALLLTGGILLAYRWGVGGSYTLVGLATIASAMAVAWVGWVLWSRLRRFSWRAVVALGGALGVANAVLAATPADPLNDTVLGYLVLLPVFYAAGLAMFVFAVSEMRLHRSLIDHRRRMETRLSQALARAEAAGRARTRVLASASHDLRTPLNAIIGYTEAIKTGIWGPLQPPRYAGYIDNIGQAADQLLHLVDQWIEVAHTTGDDWAPKPVPLPFPQIAEDVSVALTPLAGAKGIDLIFDMPSDGAAMLLDRGAVRQVVANLVGNAIKYTPRGGRVTVTGDRRDGQAILSVRDTGPGLPATIADRLGVPFQRGENALPHPGWGLGLAIVSEVVEKMGGRFTVTNPSEGGALATVALPAPLAPAAAGAADDAGHLPAAAAPPSLGERATGD